ARPMGRQRYEVGAGYIDMLRATAKVLNRTVPPPTPPVEESSCAIPGKTMVTDPAGDENPALAALTNGAGDILSLHVSEPANQFGKLIFTMKLRSLQTLPPNME